MYWTIALTGVGIYFLAILVYAQLSWKKDRIAANRARLYLRELGRVKSATECFAIQEDIPVVLIQKVRYRETNYWIICEEGYFDPAEWDDKEAESINYLMLNDSILIDPPPSQSDVRALCCKFQCDMKETQVTS